MSDAERIRIIRNIRNRARLAAFATGRPPGSDVELPVTVRPKETTGGSR